MTNPDTQRRAVLAHIAANGPESVPDLRRAARLGFLACPRLRVEDRVFELLSARLIRSVGNRRGSIDYLSTGKEVR